MTAAKHLVTRFKYLETFGRRGWYELHRELDEDTAEQEQELGLDVGDAWSKQNMHKNRYCDIFPYVSSRVLLKNVPAGCTDYVNASHVRPSGANRDYILAQGPLTETLADFWQMIVEQNVQVIVMVNRFDDHSHAQCARYVPDELGQTAVFGQVTVTLLQKEEHAFYTKREVSIKCADSFPDSASSSQSHGIERTVIHMQFTKWPDLEAPKTTAQFLKFLTEVRTVVASQAVISGSRRAQSVVSPMSDSPLLVHCLAGIGRTGTFAVIDTTLNKLQINANCSDAEIDINKTILHMRQQRMALIQTPEQLRFCWQAVADAIQDPQWAHLLEAE